MTPRQSYHQVSSCNLPDLLKKDALLVDVRRAGEWPLTGVVAGSCLLTFFDSEGNCRPKQWLAQLENMILADTPLVLICRTGHRTTLICELLTDLLTEVEVSNVTDGIFGRLAEGLPVAQVNPVV